MSTTESHDSVTRETMTPATTPIRPSWRAAACAAAAFALVAAAACTSGNGPEMMDDATPEGRVSVQAVDAAPEVQASLGEVQRGRGWREDFPTNANIRAAGEYDGEQVWELESFSALELEPSESATFRIFLGAGEREMVVDETKPGLIPNEDGGEPFFKRGEGAISALGWVETPFADVRVSADVNTEGGPQGKGAESRQGVIARWNEGNSYYWYYIDFSTGKYEILRSEGLGIFEPFLKSVGEVEGFDNRKPYRVLFEVLGGTLWGRVYDVDRNGKLGGLVGDTGKITDPEPLRDGISGVLTELALGAPFTPLEGSFARVSSVPISTRRPDISPARQATGPLPSDARLAEALDLAASGREGEAAERLEAMLEASPSEPRVLSRLAWVYATSPGLDRAPRSLELAQQAVDEVLRELNETPTSTAGIDELVRAGLSLAAAYAANGNFDPQISEAEVRQRAMAPPEGVSMSQAARALASSKGGGAIAFGQWADEVTDHLLATRPSPETRALAQAADRALAAFTAGETLTNVPLP